MILLLIGLKRSCSVTLGCEVSVYVRLRQEKVMSFDPSYLKDPKGVSAMSWPDLRFDFAAP